MRFNREILIMRLAVSGLLIQFGTAAFAQDSRLQLFEGGKIDGQFLMRSTLLNGPGTTGPLMGFTAPAKVDPFVMFGNPAALGLIGTTQIAVSFSPQVEFAAEKLSDPSPTVKEEVDAVIETFDRQDLTVDYPEVTGIIGRAGTPIGALGTVFPLGKRGEKWPLGIPRLFDRIGIGFGQPLYLNIGTVYTGLRTRLRTIDEDPENEILLYAAIKMNADVQIASNSWILAGARQTGRFWFGAGLSRTEAAIKVSGHQQIDGIMSKSQSESAFNDPRDPWTNDFFSRAVMDVNGAGWAPRLGLTYQPHRRFILGADIRFSSEFEMSGPIDFKLYRFLPLRLNAPEGEKQFDVNLIDDISELTKTTPKQFAPSGVVNASIPGQISVAATYTGPVQPSITYTKYFGELSYTLDMSEDGAPYTYKRGMKPDFGFSLALNFSALQLNVGVIKLQDLVDGYRDASGVPIIPGEPVMVPRASLGFNTAIEDNLTLGVLIFAMPEDAVRLSIIYTI